jgi:hypothetical protein
MQKDVAKEYECERFDTSVRGSIVAFTDGSCIGNGLKNAKGGYSVVFPDHLVSTLRGP